MVMGLGMRTIWISLRAMNYTDRAFRAALGNLDKLNAAEKKHLNNLLAMKDAARMNVAVGMLYAAMAGMMAQSLFSFMSTTEAGAEYMSEFTATLNEAKVALADTFFETMRPVLDVLKTFLELLRDSAPLRITVMLLAFAATAVLGLYGAYKLYLGIQGGIAAARKLNAFLIEHEIIAEKAHTLSIRGTTLAYWQLAVAIGAALGAFAIAYTILSQINNPIVSLITLIGALTVAFWALFIAESAATVGIALVAGGIAAAAAYALYQQTMGDVGSFQMGTRSAPYTGPMMVHRGEVIYNPETERPTGIAAELRRGAEPSITHQKIDIGIEHLHTEAPYDEIDEKIGRTLRRKMRNSR